MKPLIVNLLGGPGTGKSSIRGGVFHDLKFRGINCEEALEYAKDLTWKKSQFTLKNQIKVFGEQHDRLFRLLEQVDVIVTDSPLLLTPIYDNRKSNLLTELAMEEFHSMWNYTIFLTRWKAYNPIGRNQTEEEAKEIDSKIINFLIERQIPFDHLLATETCKNLIVEKVLALLGKK